MSKIYKTEAIVLNRRNYSEADRIMTLYSKHYGKLSVIAKGVRKLKSKKRSSLEVFTHIKFSAVKGKNLDIITEVETINSFEAIRNNLSKVTVAYFLMEIVVKTTGESEKNDYLFDQIIVNLGSLESRSDLKKLRHEITHDLLVTLGFWPPEDKMKDYDDILEEVLERQISSKRVGKALLS